MKKKASMTYLGPCGSLEDPTSGNIWQQGEMLEVDMETAWRLLRLPFAAWETDAPPPPPLSEESETEEPVPEAPLPFGPGGFVPGGDKT
jgi:hypothetical protein